MKQLITLTAILLLSFYSGFSQETKEQKDLILKLSFQNADTGKVNTSIDLIKLFFDSKDYDQAQSYIEQAEKLSSELNYLEGTAELRYFKALIYTENDDYLNALDFYNKSLSAYSQLNDSLGISKVNTNLGLIEIKRGNYSKGLSYSLSAIKILERKNLKRELSIAYSNLAEAYLNTNRLDKALDYNLKTLDLKEDAKDEEEVKNHLINIASIYFRKNLHSEAIDYYKRSLEYLNTDEDRYLVGEIFANLGELYLKTENIQEAEKYINDGLRLNKASDNKNGILKSLNNVAGLNIRKEKVRLAEDQADQALAIARELNNELELLKNYKLQIDIDLLKRDYRRVIDWQNQYYELKEMLDEKNAPIPLLINDSIEDENTITDNNTIDNIISTPDTSKAENNSSFFKNPTYLLYSLIGVLLFLIIAMVLGVSNNRTLNKKLNSLASENESFKTENNETQNQIANLEEANVVKDRLFSIVSHDLKDSITSIKGFIDLLKEESISKKEFSELIPELSDNADNATSLLMNLLNWSKSQIKNLDPKPESFNIQEVFKEKINLIKKKADQKQLVILDESFKDFVYADRSMIEIVIQNLLANAAKFSDTGDVITISNRHRNGHALICIEDTGVGISKENKEKLFKNEGFTTRGTEHEKGTGLGLSICKQLVEQNKGSIWVESEPNLGSRFYVELPKSEVLHDYYKNIEVNAPVVVKKLQL